MCGGRIQFNAMRIVVSDHISCKFHDRQLHAETQTQIGNLMFSCIADRMDHTFDSAVAEAAGNEDSVYITQNVLYVFGRNGFGIHPFDIYDTAIRNAAVFQRFHDADISIMELGIFADKSDRRFSGRSPQGFHHGFPVGKIRFGTVQI